MTRQSFKSMSLITVVLTALTLTACSTGTSSQSKLPSPELQPCTDPRPDMCTMDYNPVCGQDSDGVNKTYSNACGACSDRSVVGYFQGECP